MKTYPIGVFTFNPMNGGVRNLNPGQYGEFEVPFVASQIEGLARTMALDPSLVLTGPPSITVEVVDTDPNNRNYLYVFGTPELARPLYLQGTVVASQKDPTGQPKTVTYVFQEILGKLANRRTQPTPADMNPDGTLANPGKTLIGIVGQGDVPTLYLAWRS